jgi:hypothetical protein
MSRIVRATIVAALALYATPSAAQLDPGRPKLMILFDTSNSMLSKTVRQTDGSPLCNGDGKDSRVYQLKVALFNAMLGIGANEIDFGLSTFPMMMDPTKSKGCPDGHYFADPSQKDAYGCSSFNGECGAGCKVSAHIPTCGNGTCDTCTQPNACIQEDAQNCPLDCGGAGSGLSHYIATCGSYACPWYQAFKAEVLRVPFGTPPEEILANFDQLEDADNFVPLVNPEVRAGPNWTPIGKTLFYLYGYFDKEVVLPQGHYRKRCEKLSIAVFTDGGEACDKSSTNAYYPTTWAKKLYQDLGVVVNTVGIDTGNLKMLRNMAIDGGGSFFQVVGQTDPLKKAFLDIVAKSRPASEACNGRDDDCDGKIDEDFAQKGQPCDNGLLGECYAIGSYVCKTDGSGLECDAQGLSPGQEVCNGKDDDCDGKIDEDVPGGCVPCSPQLEVCNGKDDDCDGKVDEDIPSVPCGIDIGECKPGKTACVGGKTVCENAQTPTDESCNGKDDDCDGVVDGFSEVCYSHQSGCDLEKGSCEGECQLGVRSCASPSSGSAGGKWSACTGDRGPRTEICDGLDNDCDGISDEEVECADGSTCLAGKCTIACGGQEFKCPLGFICRNGWCITDPCKETTCGSQEICIGGRCVDVCADRNCASWEECVKGICEDTTCYNPKNACPSGQRCVGAVCKADPCADVSCAQNQYCYDGQCRDICELKVCGAGERCEKGQCIADPCLFTQCKRVEVCIARDGKAVCVTDPCLAVDCEKGLVCDIDDRGNTQCIADPCDSVTCPRSYRCESGECVSGVVGTRDILVTGAGGLACRATPSDHPSGAPQASAPWFLLTLLLSWLLLRRRRSARR